MQTGKQAQRLADVDIAWIQRMLAGIQDRGEPFAHFLEAAGIPARLLQRPGVRVSAMQFARLFRILMERRDDEILGFLSRPLKYGGFAVTTNYALGAHTLGQAIRRTGQALGLLQEDFSMSMRRNGAEVAVAIQFYIPDAPCHPFLHEMLMLVYWRFFSWLVGGYLPAQRIDFAYAHVRRPPSVTDIFQAPVRFDCHQTALWLSADHMRVPVRRDKLALRKYLADAQTHIIFPERFDQPISAHVNQQLQRDGARATLPSIAAALHMSTATLQRRLAAEGTSFQKSKDELRGALAMSRLRTSNVSIDRLAQELGFASSSTFQRAFKNWTGTTPGLYRKTGSDREGT